MKKMLMQCAAFDMNVPAFNPLVTFSPEAGPYKALITDIDPAYKSGKSTKFTVDLVTGPSAGQTTDFYIGNEQDEKGFNGKNWKQALLALCGCNANAPTAEAFEERCKAGLKFDPGSMARDTFKGKTIHILVIDNPGTSKDPVTGVERANLPDKRILTKAQYDQVVAAGHAPRSGAPASNGAVAGSPAPAGTPSPTPATGDTVLKNLFGN